MNQPEQSKYVSTAIKNCEKIKELLNLEGLKITPVMTTDFRNVLMLSDKNVLGNVEDEINDKGQIVRIWKPVSIDFRSIMNREITGKKILFSPELKSWTNNI